MTNVLISDGFPERLSALIKERGLTQDELAEALDVSQSAVSSWVTGIRYPGRKKFQAIANALGVGLDDLGVKLLSTDAMRFQNLAADLFDKFARAYSALSLFDAEVDGDLACDFVVAVQTVAVGERSFEEVYKDYDDPVIWLALLAVKDELEVLNDQ